MKNITSLTAVPFLAFLLIGCGEPKTAQMDISSLREKLQQTRKQDQMCWTESSACVEWTKLAIGCDENMKRRDEGFMGKLPPYCTEAETLREEVTGIELSSDPGAYNF